MNDKVKIKCPYCSKVVSINNMPGIENATLRCGACKQKSPFKLWIRVVDNDDKTLYNTDDKTQIAGIPNHKLDVNFVIGRLISLDNPKVVYKLKLGRNVVGRKANVSSADIQIFTGECRRMSREHIVIDVKNVEGHGLTHYISLYKEKLNPTYVCDEKLVYGDCLVLNHGDLIKLPDCTLIFEIPDEEGTEINN